MPGETILVIDDSPTILKVVQLVLTKAGFQVWIVEDASAGIDVPSAKLIQAEAKREGIELGVRYVTSAEVLATQHEPEA